MKDSQSFSKRLGYSAKEKEITIRDSAPDGLRNYVRVAYYDLDKKPSDLLPILCKVLKTTPQGNWSEFPNIDDENKANLTDCEWYYVYDVIEAILSKLRPNEAERFADDLNEYFVIQGIGWKIINEKIETRGDEVFESSIKNVVAVLDDAGLKTAKSEIREAIKDLSRRPEPDITGAIQHAVACLECVCREVTNDKNATLGALIKKFPGIVPKPLDTLIEKVWAYSSEQGRHLREGEGPEYLEAELLVELSSAVSTYLGKKIKSPSSESNKTW